MFKLLSRAVALVLICCLMGESATFGMRDAPCVARHEVHFAFCSQALAEDPAAAFTEPGVATDPRLVLFLGLESWEIVWGRLTAKYIGTPDPRGLIEENIVAGYEAALLSDRSRFDAMTLTELKPEFDSAMTRRAARFNRNRIPGLTLEEWLRDEFNIVHLINDAASSIMAAQDDPEMAEAFAAVLPVNYHDLALAYNLMKHLPRQQSSTSTPGAARQSA